MREACSLVWLALVGLFRSRASLEAEILIVCTESSNPDVVVMKSAKEGV